MLKRWDIGILEEGIEGDGEGGGERGAGSRAQEMENGEDSHDSIHGRGHTDMGKRRESRMTVTEGGGP